MMVNAGSSESYGVEASFLASINKNLNMNVSYGYTHSTFKNMTEVLHHQKSKLIIAAIMYHCSRHTMNAGANYSFFFDKSNWMQSLTLGMSYTGAGKFIGLKTTCLTKFLRNTERAHFFADKSFTDRCMGT